MRQTIWFQVSMFRCQAGLKPDTRTLLRKTEIIPIRTSDWYKPVDYVSPIKGGGEACSGGPTLPCSAINRSPPPEGCPKGGVGYRSSPRHQPVIETLTRTPFTDRLQRGHVIRRKYPGTTSCAVTGQDYDYEHDYDQEDGTGDSFYSSAIRIYTTFPIPHDLQYIIVFQELRQNTLLYHFGLCHHEAWRHIRLSSNTLGLFLPAA